MSGMEGWQAGILIQAMAVQAEIEGMKAANQQWPQGSPPAYDQTAFDVKANELAQLAQDLRN